MKTIHVLLNICIADADILLFAVSIYNIYKYTYTSLLLFCLEVQKFKFYLIE